MKLFKERKPKGKSEGLINNMDLNYAQYKILYSVMFAILLLSALICLLPIVWAALSGFKTPAEMYSVPPTPFPSKLDFSMIPKLLTRVRFGRYLLNTLLIIIGCLTFDIVLNGLTGYVLSVVRPRGYKILDKLIFWTMMLPGISMVPLYMTIVDVPFIHINMKGSFLPLWLMAGCSSFNIFLFRNFFNGIPKSYFDAARIDGCGSIEIFFRIIIPLSTPILVVISIFSVTSSWSNFMWPYLLLGNTAKEPLSVLVYQLSGDNVLKANENLMLMMLVAMPMIIFYSLFSKRIMGGFNMSGVKG